MSESYTQAQVLLRQFARLAEQFLRLSLQVNEGQSQLQLLAEATARIEDRQILILRLLERTLDRIALAQSVGPPSPPGTGVTFQNIARDLQARDVVLQDKKVEEERNE